MAFLSSTRQVFRSSSLLLLFFFVSSSRTWDPIKCSSRNTNCTITNSYGAFSDRSVCRVAEVVYPSTEEELISVVANATASRRKMKVATSTSHSIPKLVCPDGEDGLLISTKYLNRTLKIDGEAMTMTVESGVLLRQLINEATKAKLALVSTPYWWGLTIGGILGTGAHGSTWQGNGSAVHDFVVELRIVSPGGPEDGHVKVRTLSDGDTDFNAAKVSLGVLGVISQVTLKLQPLFKRSIEFKSMNDWDLGDRVANFGRKHEFGDITWYPNQRMAVYRIDDRVPMNTSGDGLYDFTPFRSRSSLEVAIIRTKEELLESTGAIEGKCLSAEASVSKLVDGAYGLTNDGKSFEAYPVVGYHNRFQAYGTCLDSLEDPEMISNVCPWDPRVKGHRFFHQTTFSIGLPMAKIFIQDVQELNDLVPKAMCGVELYNGILIRYVKASTAYLGKEEDAVEFDITYYRSKDPKSPRLYEDILEEIEQLALFKYGALPHWGKNRNLAFEGAIERYRNATEFLKVKDVYDPLGLFSSEWTNKVLGLERGLTVDEQGCALEGLCICSNDSHCNPNKGYYCRSGRVYKDARVCRFTPEDICPAEGGGDSCNMAQYHTEL
ncbi:probable L-gulonolactone oxidase 4 [Carya illinoinensis]|uniref:probable L-gulonolactone oxidase 4 n=1 Tax=Carya illinoinensis TaxID=32201 RepID=UPI001C71CC7A|nr:probable L-gulonolactone oxidase 4 [Carya illinoinensis]